MFRTLNYSEDVDYPLKLLLVQRFLWVSTLNVLRDNLGGAVRVPISWKGRRKGGAFGTPCLGTSSAVG